MTTQLDTTSPPLVGRSAASAPPITRLRDLSSQQWKSGIAAWLGWLFDGLDMHLYTLVAVPFVAQLMALPQSDSAVSTHSAYIQAAFLVGWALGGGFFGRIADRLGRSRALNLTILTYALFTGLSFLAQTWWHLLIFRFLAALGIGGEWAVGASLLSETWPRRWRPWLAAVLQTGVNIGVLLACLAGWLLSGFPERSVFLVGVLPAFLTLWIRRAVPEPEEWHQAQSSVVEPPKIRELFRGSIRRITILTILVCSFSLTAHWAFMFWHSQHLRQLLQLRGLDKETQTALVTGAFALVMVTSIAGNFVSALLAKLLGYRRAILLMMVGYFTSLVMTYSVQRDPYVLIGLFSLMGLFQGVFALFTMYMPPLFPTLLRTTGAGFCYNIGRLAAAAGTIFFVVIAPLAGEGLEASADRMRHALLYAGFLFIPAAIMAGLLPEPPDEIALVEPTE
jgi:MFS family permease